MQISYKTIYAFLCVLMLFLFPFVYADESVNVSFYQDGQKVETLSSGDTAILHAELVSANSSDSVQFVLQDESLQFVDSPSSSKLNVYGKYENNLWIYETKVKVLSDDPVLPEASIIRDSTQPELDNSEKPVSLSIDLNSEQIIAPGDTIEAYAVLEPAETVNKNYFNFVNWSVEYGDQEIELNQSTGESISFTVPEDAANTTVSVSAVLNGLECGLGEDLNAKTVNLHVKDDSLSVQIFPSQDSDGVLINKYLGFSSEILRNGKVAESEVSENSKYDWVAMIGDEFVNGKKEGRTNYAVSPNQVGTLSVYLKVTLENGLTLQSQTITKTVVDGDMALESVSLRQIENGDVTTKGQIEVTTQFEPAYVTNLEGATYHWVAKQDDTVIAESDSSENFVIKPKTNGPVTVKVEITPKDSETITSEPLVINVTEPVEDSSTTEDNSETEKPDQNQSDKEPIENNQENVPSRIISGVIKTERSSDGPLVAGEKVVLSANLATQGNLDNITYSWEALDAKNNVIAKSDQKDNFSFTSESPGEVKVKFKAQLNNTSDIEEEYKQLELEQTLTFVSQAESNAVSNTKEKLVTNTTETKKDDSTSTQEETVDKSNDESTNKTSEKVKTKNNQSSKETTEQKSEENKVQSKETNSKDISSNSTKESTQGSNNDNKANLTESLVGKTDNTTTTSQDSKDVKKEESETLISGAAETKEEPIKQTATENSSTGTVTTLTPQSNSSRPTSNGIVTSTGTSKYTGSGNTSSVQSGSVLNRSSNIENPKTGVDFSIGQIAVIAVCSLLIVVSVIVLVRKTVFTNPNKLFTLKGPQGPFF